MNREQRQKLVDIVEKLKPADQEAVMAFAEFLRSRAHGMAADAPAGVEAPAPPSIPPVQPVPRPENERVVAAVKRLSQTYFMLDKKQMLGVTSDLVTQHVVQGREASDVIDELERIFEEHYQRLLRGDA